jgi:hypothetical protein
MFRAPLASACVAALLLLGSGAQAQLRRDRAERAQDRRELRQDTQERRDDHRDLQALEAVLARFDKARLQNDAAELAAVDSRLRELLHAELAESGGELARDRAEVRRDNREVRSDRREVRRDVAQGKPVAAADDRHDLRDDRRDRRDDRRDAHVEAATLTARQQIAHQLAALQGKTAPAELERKRVLIADLVQLARKEQVGNTRELREDRRELREDRRETREDRRQGN